MNAKIYIDQLRKLKLDHENFRVAYNRSYAQAALAPPGQVIAIAGPTHVGKTTLSERLSPELVRERGDVIERAIPLIRVEAATTNQGKFSTKHFTLRALEELADPINMGDCVPFRRNQSETHLRFQLERCIRYRETSFLIIDEAHHLLRTPSQLRAGEVLDTLKCLGNSTGLVIILLGGYELLQTCFSSAHLNGRLTVVDFPPYTTAPESLQEFDRILLTLDGMLPFAAGQSFSTHRDFVYAGSLGCLGLLVGWAIKGLAEMQAHGDNSLRLKHLEAARHIEQIRPIKEEIALGQQLLPHWDLSSSGTSQPVADPATVCSKNQRVRAFTRKPKRDPGPKDTM